MAGYKKFLSVLACVLAVSMLSACSGASTDPQRAEIDLDAFVEEMQKADPVENPRDLDEFAVENEMGLTLEDLDAFRGVITNVQDDCALIFIAQAKEGQAREVKQELEKYRDTLTANDLYAENEKKIASAKDARIQIHGRYVVMVIAGLGSSYSDIDEALNKAFN